MGLEPSPYGPRGWVSQQQCKECPTAPVFRGGEPLLVGCEFIRGVYLVLGWYTSEFEWLNPSVSLPPVPGDACPASPLGVRLHDFVDSLVVISLRLLANVFEFLSQWNLEVCPSIPARVG